MRAGLRIFPRLRSAAVVLALLPLGCASMYASMQLEKFDTTIRAYEHAMRWSEFSTAFGLAGNADASAPNFDQLKNVRIISYDVVGVPQVNADSSQVLQLVEIGYVRVNSMVARSVSDRQIWRYSPADKRWKLLSGFPNFP